MLHLVKIWFSFSSPSRQSIYVLTSKALKTFFFFPWFYNATDLILIAVSEIKLQAWTLNENMPRMSGGEFRRLSFRRQQTRLKTELNGMANLFFCLAFAQWSREAFFNVPMRDGYTSWECSCYDHHVAIMNHIVYNRHHVALKSSARRENETDNVAKEHDLHIESVYPFINIVLDVMNNIFSSF